MVMTSSKKDTRYFSLDFWRGAACLLIVVYHSSFYVNENPANQFSDSLSKFIFRMIDHAWLGVPLFFVISGYCITAACDSTRNKAHPLRQYFFRRFRRIFPPYWIYCLLLLAAMVAASKMGFPRLFCDDIHGDHPLASFSVFQWLGNLSLTEIWRANVIGERRWFFVGQSWSLCYEEQFYAICGLLLLLSRRWFFRGAGVMTLLVGVVVLVNSFVTPLPVTGFFFDGRWLLFAAVILVYFRLHYGRPRFVKVAGLGLLAAGCAALALRLREPSAHLEEYYVGFFFAFLISVLYRWDVAIEMSRVLRPITWCGTMCYSLYLIHWPVVKITSHLIYAVGVRGPWPTLAITMPVSVFSAVAAGWGFHLLVERRFLNTQPVLPWHRSAPLATAPVTASQSSPALPTAPPSVPV